MRWRLSSTHHSITVLQWGDSRHTEHGLIEISQKYSQKCTIWQRYPTVLSLGQGLIIPILKNSKFIAQIPDRFSFCKAFFYLTSFSWIPDDYTWLTESSPKSLGKHSWSSPVFPLPYLPQPLPQPGGAPHNGVHEYSHCSTCFHSRPPSKGPTKFQVHFLQECCLVAPSSSEPCVALTVWHVHWWRLSSLCGLCLIFPANL